MPIQFLRAGVLRMRYENGFIRQLRHGSTEIVRMIYFALRDHNWGTFEPFITQEVVQQEEDSFSITYQCHHQLNGRTVFRWEATINGQADGKIVFDIRGTALEAIQKNRAGFCVLHPVQGVANQACELRHSDGTLTQLPFPRYISPQNPFQSIRTMRWQNAEGHWFALEFEGDVFETEDQRNWTDSSFKTFCTPLKLPFPVRLKKGDQVHQRVTFYPISSLPTLRQATDDSIQLFPTDRKYNIPRLGIGASTETDEISPKAVALLKALKLSHYRIEVKPYEEGWLVKLAKDVSNARQLGLPLEIALHLSHDFTAEMSQLLTYCTAKKLNVQSITAFSQGQPVTDQAVIAEMSQFKKTLPATILGAGTDYNFTELNRFRFDASGLDFVSYAIHPQEHAFDDLSLVENLESQADTVRSAHQLYGEAMSVHVSPLTLRRRFNPYATNPADKIWSNQQKVDPRQATNFAAGWTLSSIKILAEAGATSVTLFQTVGNQGIISSDGNPYPIYYALQLLRNNATIHAVESTQPVLIQGLGLENTNGPSLLIINHSPSQQTVHYQSLIKQVQPYEILQL